MHGKICNYQTQIECVIPTLQHFQGLLPWLVIGYESLPSSIKYLADTCKCDRPCYIPVTEIELIQQGDYLWLSDGSINGSEKQYLESPDMYDLSYMIKYTKYFGLFNNLPVWTSDSKVIISERWLVYGLDYRSCLQMLWLRSWLIHGIDSCLILAGRPGWYLASLLSQYILNVKEKYHVVRRYNYIIQL